MIEGGYWQQAHAATATKQKHEASRADMQVHDKKAPPQAACYGLAAFALIALRSRWESFAAWPWLTLRQLLASRLAVLSGNCSVPVRGTQATALADIFSRFVPTVESSTIFGDVTLGARCIDDLGVPTDQSTVTTLYVHVEVRVRGRKLAEHGDPGSAKWQTTPARVEVDVEHLVETIRQKPKVDSRVQVDCRRVRTTSHC
ncbi:DPH1 [Symbiodinium microadriaticum]|nr:DPH1 [Symbiodinium microadriaticum]